MQVAIALTFGVSHVYGWSWNYGGMDSVTEAQGVFVGTAPWCGGSSSSCSGSHPYWWYPVTAGTGSHCTSSSYKVYCNSYSTPYSVVSWTGTAPYCEGHCWWENPGTSHARPLCIAFDTWGGAGGSQCWRGSKALNVHYRAQSESSIEYFPTLELGFIFYNNMSQSLGDSIAAALVDAIDDVVEEILGISVTSAVSVNQGILTAANSNSSNSTIYGLNMQIEFNDMDDTTQTLVYLGNNSQNFTDTVNLYFIEWGDDNANNSMVNISFIEANVITNLTIIDESDDAYAWSMQPITLLGVLFVLLN